MNFSYPERFKPYLKSLENSTIEWNNKIVGYHSGIIGIDGEPLGGGTDSLSENAQRVAVAESLEKLEMLYGLSEKERQDFQCEKYPTRCGMAVGFEKQSTLNRSIAEGIERWAWSKWIDDGFVMPEAKKPYLKDLAAFCFSNFDEVKFFEKKIHHDIPNFPKSIRFYATIGIKDGGAFPGSRICGPNEDPWNHSLIESFRNVQIYKTLGSRKRIYSFLADRINYFGTHASTAIVAISQNRDEKWPKPEIDFSISLNRDNDNYFLNRTLCKSYIPWHLGAKDRFVY